MVLFRLGRVPDLRLPVDDDLHLAVVLELHVLHRVLLVEEDPRDAVVPVLEPGVAALGRFGKIISSSGVGQPGGGRLDRRVDVELAVQSTAKSQSSAA